MQLKRQLCEDVCNTGEELSGSRGRGLAKGRVFTVAQKGEVL